MNGSPHSPFDKLRVNGGRTLTLSYYGLLGYGPGRVQNGALRGLGTGSIGARRSITARVLLLGFLVADGILGRGYRRALRRRLRRRVNFSTSAILCCARAVLCRAASRREQHGQNSE